MRRARDRATVLGRRTNPAWATTGATSAARPDETHLHAADRQALHRPGRLTPCRMFSTCAALFGARGRAPLRLFRDAGRATRTPEPATIEGYNAACIERGRSGVSRQRWRGAPRAGSGLDSRSEGGGEVVEPALYTVEGRQTADLRQKCGSALIRKAKLPARSCGRSSLFAGAADKAH
jgi:hypothetical protein